MSAPPPPESPVAAKVFPSPNHGERKDGRRPNLLVLHYTGSGSSSKGAALANCQYFGRANRNASAHYFVDDGSIYEYADPKKWYTWHCGDGHGKYGITNANSIGIGVSNSTMLGLKLNDNNDVLIPSDDSPTLTDTMF